MLGPFDYAVTLLGFLAELYVVVRLCTSKNWFRYFSLNIYMLAAATVTVVGALVLRQFGVSSPTYAYVYYYTDALLTITLFFVIMSFYQQVFHQMGVGKYVRWASVFLLSATALFSYLVVRQMPSHHLTSRFVVEMSQNLYFVGVVLTYLLWGAILKLRETRTRLIQLVLALGIFFSADAAAYALRNLFPGLEANFLKWIPPVVGTFLPLAWAYTFTKISESARLETARVAMPRMAAHQPS
ncbi:MAG TPA: hypothetical protein VGU63_04405 [Candidatus Acidoferrales bacterium]|nr:hypothetical protein [Candidatus Acidoferrales bacterium]